MTVFLGFTTGLFLGSLIVTILASLTICSIQEDIETNVNEKLDRVENLMGKFEARQTLKDFGIE